MKSKSSDAKAKGTAKTFSKAQGKSGEQQQQQAAGRSVWSGKDEAEPTEEEIETEIKKLLEGEHVEDVTFSAVCVTCL